MAIKIHLSKILGEKRINMKELSGMTGMWPNTISKIYYEDIKRIDIEHINALCKALGCQVGDIFEYVED